MQKNRFARLKLLTAAVATVSVLGLLGCAQTDGGSEATGAPADVARAQADLDMYMAGVFESPPETAPAAPAGVNVWIVTYGLAATPGADFDQGAKDAANLLGWETTSCDGEFSTTKWQECYRQAIAAGADALAIYVNDCASTKAALEEARAAGVLLVSAEATDCDAQQEGAEPLFDYQVEFAQGAFDVWLGDLLKPAAAYAITQLGDDANFIMMEENTDSVRIMTEETIAYIGELCPRCTISEVVEYTAADFGGALQEKVGQSILKNPDANVILAPYDDATLSALGAVRESGRELMLTAGPGNTSTFDLIRSGEVAGAYVQELAWEGWAVIDAINRILNGEEPVNSGQGIGWVDSSNIDAYESGYVSPIDFRSIYTNAFASSGN